MRRIVLKAFAHACAKHAAARAEHAARAIIRPAAAAALVPVLGGAAIGCLTLRSVLRVRPVGVGAENRTDGELPSGGARLE